MPQSGMTSNDNLIKETIKMTKIYTLTNSPGDIIDTYSQKEDD